MCLSGSSANTQLINARTDPADRKQTYVPALGLMRLQAQHTDQAKGTRTEHQNRGEAHVHMMAISMQTSPK